MNKTETDDDSAEIDKLLTELENETLSEVSSSDKSEKIKDKQAEETLTQIKYEKPEWADKKDDDYNTYEYIEKEVEDSEW